MAAGAAETDHGQEAFPFMRLPPEIRIMVYEFALRDITDPIMFPPSGEAQKPQPYRGALALLHTGKHIRHESHQAMKHIARSHYKALIGACMTIAERKVRLSESGDFESTVYRQAQDDYRRTSYQADCMEVVTKAMHKVVMAEMAGHEAGLKKRRAALLSLSTRAIRRSSAAEQSHMSS